jgi:hypothetical protein
MQGNAVKEKMLDPAQYVVPGKAGYGAVLSKILFLDISRQTRSECGFGDLDALACFDRVLPSMAVITCQRLGLPPHATSFMLKLLQELTFSIKISHGNSEDYYKANRN